MANFDIKSVPKNPSAVSSEPRQAVAGSPCKARPVHRVANRTNLGPEDRKLLSLIGTGLQVPRGQSIFTESDPALHLYTIVEGAVVIHKMLADGRRQITGFLFAGDFIGLADAEVYAYNADTFLDSVLLRYPFSDLVGLFKRHPELESKLFAIAQHEIAEAHAQMLLLGRGTPKEKVASFLLRLADRAVLRGEDQDDIFVPMKRHDIADYLGMTMETVSRVISQLRQEGLILPKGYSQIRILDRAGLIRAAA